MDNSWVMNVETDIYTIVKTRVMARLSEKYPDMVITMSDESNVETVFPTIYIHFHPSIEIGGDIEGSSINGILCTVEYRIICSSKQGLNSAREIAGCIIGTFKELYFKSITTAEFQNNGQDTVRMVGRVRRAIGQADSLN